jgi:hypothetical protein
MGSPEREERVENDPKEEKEAERPAWEGFDDEGFASHFASFASTMSACDTNPIPSPDDSEARESEHNRSIWAKFEIHFYAEGVAIQFTQFEANFQAVLATIGDGPAGNTGICQSIVDGVRSISRLSLGEFSDAEVRKEYRAFFFSEDGDFLEPGEPLLPPPDYIPGRNMRGDLPFVISSRAQVLNATVCRKLGIRRECCGVFHHFPIGDDNII